MQHRLVGDDVAGDAAADADRVESLAVGEPVDLDRLGLVRGEPVERGRELVDRVLADPAAGGVRAQPVGAQLDAQVAVAAALDLPVRRLAEDREVAREQVGAVAARAARGR